MLIWYEFDPSSSFWNIDKFHGVAQKLSPSSVNRMCWSFIWVWTLPLFSQSTTISVQFGSNSLVWTLPQFRNSEQNVPKFHLSLNPSSVKLSMVIWVQFGSNSLVWTLPPFRKSEQNVLKVHLSLNSSSLFILDQTLLFELFLCLSRVWLFLFNLDQILPFELFVRWQWQSSVNAYVIVNDWNYVCNSTCQEEILVGNVHESAFICMRESWDNKLRTAFVVIHPFRPVGDVGVAAVVDDRGVATAV